VPIVRRYDEGGGSLPIRVVTAALTTSCDFLSGAAQRTVRWPACGRLRETERPPQFFSDKRGESYATSGRIA